MPLRQDDARARLFGLFLLGLVLFIPPIVMLPAGGAVFGIPTLYFYLFGVWALLIFALAWVIERRGGHGTRDGS